MGKAVKVVAGLAVVVAAAGGGGYWWAQNQANARVDAAWNAFASALPKDVKASYDSRAVDPWTKSATLGGVRIVFPETQKTARIEIAQVVATDLKDSGRVADFALTGVKIVADNGEAVAIGAGQADDADFVALAEYRPGYEGFRKLAAASARFEGLSFESVAEDAPSDAFAQTIGSVTLEGLADGKIARFGFADLKARVQLDRGMARAAGLPRDAADQPVVYELASFDIGPIDGAMFQLAGDGAVAPSLLTDIPVAGLSMRTGESEGEGASKGALGFAKFDHVGFDLAGFAHAVQTKNALALLNLTYGSVAIDGFAFTATPPEGGFMEFAIDKLRIAETAKGRFGGLTIEGYSTKMAIDESPYGPVVNGSSRTERLEIGPIDVAAIVAKIEAEAYADILAASGFTHWTGGASEASYDLTLPRDEGAFAIKMRQGGSGLTVERDGDAVAAVELKVPGVVVTGDFAKMEAGREELAKLGLTAFELTLDFDQRVDFAKRLFTTDLDLGLTKGGKLDFDLAFGSIPTMDQMTSERAFQMAMMQVTVDGFELNYVDESLVGRVLDVVAEEQGMTREDLIAQIGAGLRMTLGDQGKGGEVVGAVESFLANPGALNVSAKPAAPVPAVGVGAAAAVSPALALENLNVTVVATPPTP